MHTTATDGRATLEEMAEAARALGYEYIAITDHSKAMAMTFGLDEKRVVEFAQTVRRINESGNLGIRIFSGLECDILKEARWISLPTRWLNWISLSAAFTATWVWNPKP